MSTSQQRRSTPTSLDLDLVRWNLSRVDWDFTGFVPSATSTGIHTLHWYPAPFPPALAGTLIDILSSPGDTFLDPFAGTGVAPIEAWLRGHRVIGIDSNDFAIRLCKAKVQLLERGTASVGVRLVESYRRYRRKRIGRWTRRTAADICSSAGIHADADRWFVRQVLAELAVLKSWLADPESGLGEWNNVATIIASSLLHSKFSKVRNYHYTYVVDRSRVTNEVLQYVDVETLLSDRLSLHFTDAENTRQRLVRTGTHLSQLTRPKFLRGLAQKAASAVPHKVDLILTSPPYFGMNDYVRSQYLTWLIFPWTGYDTQIRSEVGSRRSRTSKPALGAYLAAIEHTIQSCYRILSPGGILAMVMGNSGNVLAQDSDPAQSVKDCALMTKFTLIWEGKRRVKFRKINNTPYELDPIRWTV